MLDEDSFGSTNKMLTLRQDEPAEHLLQEKLRKSLFSNPKA
jgi:hypothetical protein